MNFYKTVAFLSFSTVLLLLSSCSTPKLANRDALFDKDALSQDEDLENSVDDSDSTNTGDSADNGDSANTADFDSDEDVVVNADNTVADEDSITLDQDVEIQDFDSDEDVVAPDETVDVSVDEDIAVDIDNAIVDTEIDEDSIVDEDESLDEITDESIDESADEISDDDIVIILPNVIPTHQTMCYDNTAVITCPTSSQDFYGQDAQYPEKTRIFTVQGGIEKTVVDSMTTLEWQQTVDATTKNWAEAGTHCDGNYGGHSDWRLPTVQELSTLPHYGKVTPAIDRIAFPETSATGFWSSTTYARYTDFAWYVYFNDGRVYSEGKISDFYVRCVRGSYNPTSSFTVSTVSGDAVVTDSATNLVWQQIFVSKRWKEALTYCEGLNYADKTDWRLPDVNELKTIVDYAQYDPAIDETVFPGTPLSYFWSSTTYADTIDYAWTVSFSRGNVYSRDKTNDSYVRCVR